LDRVAGDLGIRGQQQHVFDLSLSHQQTVKRIAMQSRQFRNTKNMLEQIASRSSSWQAASPSEHALLRRSQRHRLNWSRFNRLTRKYVPSCRVLHPYPEERFFASRP
jgi:hypothetical protein